MFSGEINKMHKLTRMRYSREHWKEKAKARANENRDNRKTINKKDQKIADLEKELNRLRQMLEAEKK